MSGRRVRKSDHRRTDNHHRDVLPGAIFGMLIVYCLRSVSVTEYSWGLPELIAGAATVGIHLWKRSMLLSIAAGTVIYMLLVQFVFV